VPRRYAPQRDLPRARHKQPKSPGGPPVAAKRELYIALMAQGTNNAAAFRLVGVNRRTGTRWSKGRHLVSADGWVREYPAITRPAPPPVPARFLSGAGAGRYRRWGAGGRNARSIAAHLGRSPSTISRNWPKMPTRRRGVTTLSRRTAGRTASGSSGSEQAGPAT
jgi:transposase, IS30 family